MTWILSAEPAHSADAVDTLYAYTHEVASRWYGREATDAEVRPYVPSPRELHAPRGRLFLARSLVGPAPGQLASRTGPVARLAAEISGCVAVHLLRPGLAELKRLWVVPDQRGGGLGDLLVHRAEQVAHEEWGARSIRLDTRADLVEARTLYARRGYHEIPRYNDAQYAAHWLEKTFA